MSKKPPHAITASVRWLGRSSYELTVTRPMSIEYINCKDRQELLEKFSELLNEMENKKGVK